MRKQEKAWAKRRRKAFKKEASTYSRGNLFGSLRPTLKPESQGPCRDGVAGCEVEHTNEGNTHPVPVRAPLGRSLPLGLAMIGFILFVGILGFFGCCLLSGD